MKLAIVGKGGSGKTSISGTLARLIARDGRRVLAIDGDANPNLALTLGLSAAHQRALVPLADDLLVRTPQGALTPALTRTLADIRAAHAATCPDGVELLVMARPENAGTGCLSHLHATVRSIIAVAPPCDVCLLDTDASPELFSRGVPQYADAMLAVVEPYPASLETGRRVGALARDLGVPRFALLVNKVRDAHELARAAAFAAEHGLELAGAIPFDASFGVAERARVAPLDHAPTAPAVTAIGGLVRSWAR